MPITIWKKIEAMNKIVKNYLCWFIGDRPKDWSAWINLAEWWYNSTQYLSTNITPFKAPYGYPWPKLLDYVPACIKFVKTTLHTRDQISKLLQNKLHRTQSCIKIFGLEEKRTWTWERRVGILTIVAIPMDICGTTV